MKREITRKEWNNAQGRRVIHNTTAHHPLRDTQPSPKQQSAALSQLPTIYTLDFTFCEMQRHFGQVWVSILHMTSFSCTSSLPEHGTLEVHGLV